MRRVITVQSFVSAIHPLRLAVVLPDIGKSFLYGIQVFFVRMLLIVNNRLFDTLGQIDTMDGVEAGQVIPVEEHVDEVIALFM